MPRHLIKKQEIQLEVASRKDAQHFYEICNKICQKELPRLLESLFDNHVEASKNISFDKIVLDLGSLNKSNIEKELPKLIVEQLKKFLNNNTKQIASFQSTSPTEVIKTEWETITFFLERGFLPWWVKKTDEYDLDAIIQKKLTTSPNKMTQLVQRYQHRPTVIKRLFSQIKKETSIKCITYFAKESTYHSKWTKIILNSINTSTFTKRNKSSLLFASFFIALLQSKKNPSNLLSAFFKSLEKFNHPSSQLLRKRVYQNILKNEVKISQLEILHLTDRGIDDAKSIYTTLDYFLKMGIWIPTKRISTAQGLEHRLIKEINQRNPIVTKKIKKGFANQAFEISFLSNLKTETKDAFISACFKHHQAARITALFNTIEQIYSQLFPSKAKSTFSNRLRTEAFYWLGQQRYFNVLKLNDLLFFLVNRIKPTPSISNFSLLHQFANTAKQIIHQSKTTNTHQLNILNRIGNLLGQNEKEILDVQESLQKFEYFLKTGIFKPSNSLGKLDTIDTLVTFLIQEHSSKTIQIINNQTFDLFIKNIYSLKPSTLEQVLHFLLDKKLKTFSSTHELYKDLKNIVGINYKESLQLIIEVLLTNTNLSKESLINKITEHPSLKLVSNPVKKQLIQKYKTKTNTLHFSKEVSSIQFIEQLVIFLQQGFWDSKEANVNWDFVEEYLWHLSLERNGSLKNKLLKTLPNDSARLRFLEQFSTATIDEVFQFILPNFKGLDEWHQNLLLALEQFKKETNQFSNKVELQKLLYDSLFLYHTNNSIQNKSINWTKNLAAQFYLIELLENKIASSEYSKQWQLLLIQISSENTTSNKKITIVKQLEDFPEVKNDKQLEFWQSWFSKIPNKNILFYYHFKKALSQPKFVKSLANFICKNEIEIKPLLSIFVSRYNDTKNSTFEVLFNLIKLKFRQHQAAFYQELLSSLSNYSNPEFIISNCIKGFADKVMQTPLNLIVLCINLIEKEYQNRPILKDEFQKTAKTFTKIPDETLQQIQEFFTQAPNATIEVDANIEKVILEKAKDNNPRLRQLIQQIYADPQHIPVLVHRHSLALLEQISQLLCGDQWDALFKSFFQSSRENSKHPLHEIIAEREKRTTYIAIISILSKNKIRLSTQELIQQIKITKEQLAKEIYQVVPTKSNKKSSTTPLLESNNQSDSKILATQLQILQSSDSSEYRTILKQVEDQLLITIQTTPEIARKELMLSLKNRTFRNAFFDQINEKTFAAIYQLFYDTLPNPIKENFKLFSKQVIAQELHNAALENVMANVLMQYVLDVSNKYTLNWNQLKRQLAIQLSIHTKKNILENIAIPTPIKREQTSFSDNNQSDLENQLLDVFEYLFHHQKLPPKSNYKNIPALEQNLPFQQIASEEQFFKVLKSTIKTVEKIDWLFNQLEHSSLLYIFNITIRQIHSSKRKYIETIFQQIKDSASSNIVKQVMYTCVKSILLYPTPHVDLKTVLQKEVPSFSQLNQPVKNETSLEVIKDHIVRTIKDGYFSPIAPFTKLTILESAFLDSLKNFYFNDLNDIENLWFDTKYQGAILAQFSTTFRNTLEVFFNTNQKATKAVDIAPSESKNLSINNHQSIDITSSYEFIHYLQTGSFTSQKTLDLNLAIQSLCQDVPLYFCRQLMQLNKRINIIDRLENQVDNVSIQLILATFCKTIHHFEWHPIVEELNKIIETKNIQNQKVIIFLFQNIIQKKTLTKYSLTEKISAYLEKYYFEDTTSLYNTCAQINPSPKNFLTYLEDKMAETIEMEEAAAKALTQKILQEPIAISVIESSLQEKNALQYFFLNNRKAWWDQHPKAMMPRWIAFVEQHQSEAIEIIASLSISQQLSVLKELPITNLQQLFPMPSVKDLNVVWEFLQTVITSFEKVHDTTALIKDVLITTQNNHRNIHHPIDIIPLWIANSSILAKSKVVDKISIQELWDQFNTKHQIHSSKTDTVDSNATPPSNLQIHSGQIILDSNLSNTNEVNPETILDSISEKPITKTIAQRKKDLFDSASFSEINNPTINESSSEDKEIQSRTLKEKQAQRLYKELSILQCFLTKGYLPKEAHKMSQAAIDEMLYRQLERHSSVTSTILLTCFKQANALERFLQYFTEKVQQKVIQIISLQYPLPFEAYWQDMRLIVQQNKYAPLQWQLPVTHRKHLLLRYAAKSTIVQSAETYVEDWILYLVENAQKEYQPLLKSFVQSLPKIQDQLESDLADILIDLDKAAYQARSKQMEEKMTTSTKQGEHQLPPEGIPIHNAGLVILASFLYRYFNRMELLDKRAFKDEEAAIRGTHLLQYLVTQQEEHPEHLLVFNKVLCGLPIDTPVPLSVGITEQEKKTSEQMYRSIIANWPKMEKSTIENLRASFIIREGHLQEKTDKWILEVESKTFDILLEFLPWTISVINLPWMEKRIEVIWKTRH